MVSKESEGVGSRLCSLSVGLRKGMYRMIVLIVQSGRNVTREIG